MEKNDEEIKKFASFASAVLDRPGMFNVNNVEDLDLILLGYFLGLGATIGPCESLNEMLSAFRAFINNEFDTKGDYDWARIIRFNSAGDQHSIELFKLKFNHFMSTY